MHYLPPTQRPHWIGINPRNILWQKSGGHVPGSQSDYAPAHVGRVYVPSSFEPL